MDEILLASGLKFNKGSQIRMPRSFTPKDVHVPSTAQNKKRQESCVTVLGSILVLIFPWSHSRPEPGPF